VDAIDTAKALAAPIGDLGSRFMMSPATFARAGEVNLAPGLELYVLGRFGVLGDVAGDVVAAAGVFLEPTALVALWDKARAASPPAAGAALFTDACAVWGRENLAGIDDLDELCALAERVADSADVALASLFAGWRAVPRPADAPARAALVFHVLRELRFCRHAVAALAAGLTPLESVLAGPGGAGNAKMFSWPEPYPDVASLAATRQGAEDRTDELSARDYAVLDATERARLVELVTAVRTALAR
jgi:hypothetical protein